MHQSSPTFRIALLALVAALLTVGVLFVDDARRTGAGRAAALAGPAAATGLAPAGDAAGSGTGSAAVGDGAGADTGSLVAAAPASAAPQAGAAGDAFAAAGAAPGASDVQASSPPVRRAAPTKLAGGVPCAAPHQVVQVDRDVPVMSAPRGGTRLGTLPASTSYLGQPMAAWVRETSPDGAWGRVTVPWYGSSRAGWARIDSFARSSTRTMVVADLSSRRIRVLRGCETLFSVPMAVGAASSASPTGKFFVTDRVQVPASQPQFGSFAFGLSAVQPNVPAGWTGGDQMAIHGTNDPSSIGRAVSAGCLRVSERTLGRLQPLLRPGTPVVIVA